MRARVNEVLEKTKFWSLEEVLEGLPEEVTRAGLCRMGGTQIWTCREVSCVSKGGKGEHGYIFLDFSMCVRGQGGVSKLGKSF